MGSEHSDVLENGHMFSMNPLDPSEFRRQAHMVVDFIADYYCNVEKYPVRSQVDPGYLGMLLPSSAPDEPEPIEDILDDIQAHIVPGLTHWQSPNHFAYFPSSGSTAGFLGEMLSVGFNVVGFNWMASPAATELECIVMDWLGKLIELPTEFLFAGGGGGVLQGTTCEAMLCTIVAARDKALQKIGKDGINRLVVYGSDQTHFALQKAARIAGIHPDNYRAIETYRSDQFCLSPESLQQVVSNDIDIGLVPLYLCATVGTTPSTAVDPLAGLCKVAHEHCMWVHVDAACAGSACICPEFRHHIDGVEGASSFSFNAHKWFLTTLDCCCLWVKEPAALISALSTDPELLKSSNGTESNRMVNYKDWQIQLSRRFRALKLWMVLRSYGTTQLRNFLRGHVNMARLFEGLVGADPRFEVVVPTNFAMVCFRFVESESELVRTNEVNRRILEAVNSTGRAYMTHAMVGGMYAMRFAVGATLTEEHHVRGAWDVIRECADAQLPLTFCDREEGC